jgi:predicted lipoprotein with Yx(FWY)xxD motif
MLKKTVLLAALALALAAAGVATAAAVTHKSSGSLAASHGTVNLRKTNLGKVLAAKSGLTLYLFMADRHGKSACNGQCTTYWPPLIKKGKLRAGAGVKAKFLRTTKRKDGRRQVTYKGHPLYRFSGDSKAGDTSGEGQKFFGGKWYAVSAAGKAVKKAPGGGGGTTSTTGTTATTTTCGYRGC